MTELERADKKRASLLLEAVFLADTGVEKEALRFILRFYNHSGIATLAILGLLYR